MRERTLYETAFKHGLILEETVWATPAIGNPTVVRRDFMVGDHILVQLPGEAARERLEDWTSKRGYSIRRKLRTAPIYVVGTTERSVDAVENLRKAFDEAFPGPGAAARADAGGGLALPVAEPDYVLFPVGQPDDAQFPQLWGMHNTGQTGGTADADIDAPETWERVTGSRSVLVGVIDTGVDRLHPDLAANMWSNPAEIADNGIDDDQNGFVDDTWGWDFFSGDNDPADGGTHGTHVAGTIGAVGNNGVGVAGVNWEVGMVSIRFLGPAGGTTADAIEAVRYATMLDVDLTSNSWGGGGFSSLLEEAIEEAGAAGILFVAAAGNNGRDNDATPSYPASYPAGNIVSVAASDAWDARASFSNWGGGSVDLAAPGTAIYSTLPEGGYGIKSGTSMAAPHVSGALALLKSAAPELPHLEMKRRLLASVDPAPAFATATVSGGRLNLFTALQTIGGAFLDLVEVTIDDSGQPGSDGLINPGEEVALGLHLRNRGVDPAHDLVATLSLPEGSRFAVRRAASTLGEIEPGGQVTGPATFVIEADASAPTPYSEQATIRLEWGQSPRESMEIEHTLSVVTSSSLAGRVVTVGEGDPIAGATITYSGPSSGTVTTDGQGRYAVIVIDGDYLLSAVAPGRLDSGTVPITVPPSRADIDFSLGKPSLEFAPASVATTLLAGDQASRTVTLRNAGDVPLEWSLGHIVESSARVVELPGGTVSAVAPDQPSPHPETFHLPAATAAGVDLSGVTVGILGAWSYAPMAEMSSRALCIDQTCARRALCRAFIWGTATKRQPGGSRLATLFPLKIFEGLSC